jgi:hypothetical protein
MLGSAADARPGVTAGHLGATDLIHDVNHTDVVIAVMVLKPSAM